MVQQDYLTQAISTILDLINNLADKKANSSIHHYKSILNEIYLKYFGCDRRAVNTFHVDYFLESCCKQDNFHPQKGLLLIWLYLEEADLSNGNKKKQQLIKNATTLYLALTELLPEHVIILIKSKIKEQLAPILSALSIS